MGHRSDQTLDYREYPVLYVDDERENLRAFELTFRREFEIRTADSGAAALDLLNREPIAIVLSDHRMPEMTGTEFLARVREFAPRTIRMLVTAYGDAETLAAAINSGAVYRYVPKPWDVAEMRSCLRQAIEFFRLGSDRERLLAELSSLQGISTALASELDLDVAVRIVLRSLVEELGFDAASLLLLEQNGCVLGRGKAYPPDGGVAEYVEGLTIGRKAAPELFAALEAKRSLLLTHDEGKLVDPAVRAVMAEIAADQVLIVPVAGARGIVGALLLDNRKGGSPFGPAEGKLVEGVASQAGIAIENAQLVAELRRRVGLGENQPADSEAAMIANGASLQLEAIVEPVREFVLKMAQVEAVRAEARMLELCRESAQGLDQACDILAFLRSGPESCERGPSILADDVVAVGALLETQARRAGVTLRVESSSSGVSVQAAPAGVRMVVRALAEYLVGRCSEGGVIVIGLLSPPGGSGVELRTVPKADLEVGFDEHFDPWSDAPGAVLLRFAEAICRRIGADLQTVGHTSGELVLRVTFGSVG